jgi:hypothetical protein
VTKGGMLVCPYLHKGSRNTSCAAVQTKTLTLGLSDDIPSVLGLSSTQAGQVTSADQRQGNGCREGEEREVHYEGG